MTSKIPKPVLAPLAASRSNQGEITQTVSSSKPASMPAPDTKTAGSLSRTIAVSALNPVVSAALTINDVAKGGEGFDIRTLVSELERQVQAVANGDLGRAEAMLVAQASTLDGVFNALARRAAGTVGQNLPAADTYMRLALRAQAQCVRTLETLATLKNPPQLAFVRQANVAVGGPQQVNNCVQAPVAEPSRAGENESRPTKLLEQTNGERLDTGSTSAGGGADPHLEAVAAVNRAEDA